jgi:glucokinase
VNYHLKDELQKYTAIPVLLENDVNLAAIGIHEFEVAKGFDNVLVVFIGTGIGGGLILNGKIYRGGNLVAGEIGHIPVDDKGAVCGCGKKGCFEAVASRSAIVREIVKDIRAGKRSVLAKVVKSKTQIKSKALLNALLEDDPLTWRHVKKACDTIGKTLAGINNLLNLDMIVLGGGVIEAMKKQTVPLIKASFKEHSLKEASRHTKVVVSKLLDDAALFGGIGLAKEFLDIEV